MQEIVRTPEEIRIDLEKTIRQRESELAPLRAALEELTHGKNGDKSTVTSTEFAKMRVSDAICAYLNKTGKPCRVEPDLRETLVKGGVDLGKVPKKAVKLGIVANADRLFYDKANDTVYLREWVK